MDLSKMSQPAVSCSFCPNNVSTSSLAGSSPIRYAGNPSTFPAAFAMMDYSHPMSAIGAANPYRLQQPTQAAQQLTPHQQQYLAAHQLQAAQEAMRYRAAAFFPTSQVSPNMGPLPFPSFAYPALAGYPPQFAPGYPRNFFGRFVQREAELPKPQHSYIGLIAMAILSSPEKKMILNDIYQWIQDHYPYFKSRPPGWKNSIRHNLSLNACFVKSGRSATGKGHFWAIHKANVRDFTNGDFRRRKAQQKVHRMNGRAAGEDEDDIDFSPSTSPSLSEEKNQAAIYDDLESPIASTSPKSVSSAVVTGSAVTPSKAVESTKSDPVAVPVPVTQRKRGGFDMDSLLAPDTKEKGPQRFSSNGSQPVFETKEETLVSPMEQYLTGPRPFDFTKEQWDHSLSRIIAHSYSAKFNNSS